MLNVMLRLLFRLHMLRSVHICHVFDHNAAVRYLRHALPRQIRKNHFLPIRIESNAWDSVANQIAPFYHLGFRNRGHVDIKDPTNQSPERISQNVDSCPPKIPPLHSPLPPLPHNSNFLLLLTRPSPFQPPSLSMPPLTRATKARQARQAASAPTWENPAPKSEAMKCCAPDTGFGFWGDEITAKFFDPTLEYSHTDPKTGPVFVPKLPVLHRRTFPFGQRAAVKLPE